MRSLIIIVLSIFIVIPNGIISNFTQNSNALELNNIISKQIEIDGFIFSYISDFPSTMDVNIDYLINTSVTVIIPSTMNITIFDIWANAIAESRYYFDDPSIPYLNHNGLNPKLKVEGNIITFNTSILVNPFINNQDELYFSPYYEFNIQSSTYKTQPTLRVIWPSLKVDIISDLTENQNNSINNDTNNLLIFLIIVGIIIALVIIFLIIKSRNYNLKVN